MGSVCLHGRIGKEYYRGVGGRSGGLAIENAVCSSWAHPRYLAVVGRLVVAEGEREKEGGEARNRRPILNRLPSLSPGMKGVGR